jgi:hypothetical protein
MPQPKDLGPAQPRRNAGEQESPRGGKQERPAAGPHAKDHLTNEDATPGAGSLSDEKSGDIAEPGTG